MVSSKGPRVHSAPLTWLCRATNALQARFHIRPDSVAEVDTYDFVVQYVYAEVDPER